MNPKPTTNTVALICLLCAVGLMVYLFGASRTDPSLRIAALVAGTGLVASLGSIASTILTGKDVTGKRDPADLPPGSVVSSTSTEKVAVPPVSESTSQDVKGN